MSDDETLDEHESITTVDAHVRGVLIDGRYRLGAALASGGMGTVYEARHLRCGYTVALKLSAAGQHMSARLLREAQLAVQLDDPGVVRILDIGEPEGRCYIAMERLHGRDLEAPQAALLESSPPLVARLPAHPEGLTQLSHARVTTRQLRVDESCSLVHS